MRLLVMTVLMLCGAATVSAENWVRYSSQTMNFPAGERVVRGNSESFYDADSVRYFDGTRVEIRLKHVTYIGDLVPHTSNELIRIDCRTNGFVSLIPDTADPAVLKEINRGEIGGDSAYRIITDAYCGVPVPRR